MTVDPGEMRKVQSEQGTAQMLKTPRPYPGGKLSHPRAPTIGRLDLWDSSRDVYQSTPLGF